MLDRIQESGRALQKAHDELEQKVIERTEELRRKEEELFQSRKLESIGRLAGGVAHDFNNLLTGILGCTESLETDIPASNPLHVDVQQIKGAAERAATLTRQLLAFGRKQIIRPQSIDLNALVGSTGNLLRRLIGEDITISYELQPGLGRLRADAGQLDQLLINLAVNARDAMPKGGQLLIKTSQITLEEGSEPNELPRGAYVMLSISDTGVGMSEEVRSKIFEPFFTTKEMGKGPGLGLATVYGVVKQNSGTIMVYSHEGLGTTFKILLPVEKSAGEKRLIPDTDSQDGADALEPRGETILVVEDEAIVLSHIARLLTRKGYYVLLARSAKEAFDAAAKAGETIDLILSDIVMPEMDGLEMVDRLRTRFPATPVLFMSGYPADVIARR